MRAYFKKIEYKCFNDCRQSGCPGHTMQVQRYCTMDMLEFFVDGKEMGEPISFSDIAAFEAAIASYQGGTDEP